MKMYERLIRRLNPLGKGVNDMPSLYPTVGLSTRLRPSGSYDVVSLPVELTIAGLDTPDGRGDCKEKKEMFGLDALKRVATRALGVIRLFPRS